MVAQELPGISDRQAIDDVLLILHAGERRGRALEAGVVPLEDAEHLHHRAHILWRCCFAVSGSVC